MSRRSRVVWCAGCAIILSGAAPGMLAQYAAAPTAYSVTQINGMFGTPVTMQVYRDGSKAVIDQTNQGRHTRTFYDLQAHTNYSWDVANPAKGCSSGEFSGDWGDPFSVSDVDELMRSAAKPPGRDTINGFGAEVFEAVDPKTHISVKVWREPKHGLVIRADMTPPGGPTSTIIETKQFSAGKPATSLFTLPEPCVKAGPPVHVPTPAERFAAETGDDGANFVEATTGPGSPNSCTMMLRVVRAGSMEPLTDFQIALDLNVDFDHPAHYVMGESASGRTTFSGGGLKEYTAQMRNGALRVEDVPEHFDVEMTFGRAGASSALIYRKCARPQTVLLLVVKNPDKLSDGADWMWVKSGKFASVARR